MLKKGSRRTETLIEDMKEEAAKKAGIHETIASENQKKDQLIIEYRDKVERCNRALEVIYIKKKSRDIPRSSDRRRLKI